MSERTRGTWVRLGRGAAAVAGIVVVALLIRALGPARIYDHLRAVGTGFGWLLAAYGLANVIYAFPLGVVLPRASRPSARALIESRFAAVAVNAATPFLGVGGEPARLLWMEPANRRQGVAALVVDRGAFLLASALFLVGGATVAALLLPLPRIATFGLLFVAAVGLALSLTLYSLQRGGGIATPLARVAGFFARRHRQRLLDRAAELDARVRDLHLDGRGRFTLAVFLHLLGRVAAALEIYAGARLLGMNVGLTATLILSAIPLAVDFLFSMVPSQVGFHEGANALLAQALGFDPAAGLALAFLQRLRQVVFVSAGFLLLALRRARPENAAVPRAAAQS